MKFVIDVCLSPGWISTLSEAGHDATHWSEIGELDASDETILAYARQSGNVLFTHDLDFGAILAASGAASPSVIQLREQDTDPSVIGQAVLAAIEQCQVQLEQGALITVDLRRAKARILPIR